jgi:membrane-associated phospholipid phosphatase
VHHSSTANERVGTAALRLAGSARDLAGWWQGTYVLVALLIATAGAFVALALAAHVTPYFEIDLQLARAVQSFRHPTLDSAARFIDWPGFPPQSNVIFGGLVLLLAMCRQVLSAICQIAAAGGSAALWFWIAPLVNRPRPSADLIYVSLELPYGSFPSGHVLNLTAGFGFAWYLAYGLLPPSPWRSATLWLVPIYLVLLGIARVYQGHHWPSDIAGGVLLGAIWLWLCIATYRWLERSLRSRREGGRVSE